MEAKVWLCPLSCARSANGMRNWTATSISNSRRWGCRSAGTPPARIFSKSPGLCCATTARKTGNWETGCARAIAVSRTFSTRTSVTFVLTARRGSRPTLLCWTARAWAAARSCACRSLCASDSRIQDFLDSYLGNVCPHGAARLPANTFVLDREGMARVLSLPVTSDVFSSPYVNSYRLPQGVLHNPRSDRRTTQGLFNIAEGGFPVPADKAAVPKQAFAALWSAAALSAGT